jgi:hypothetical protein
VRRSHAIDAAGIGDELPMRPAVANVSRCGKPIPMPIYWGRSIGLGLFCVVIMASAPVSAARKAP